MMLRRTGKPRKAVTITLNATLVAQLQAQAEGRNLSVEALALHILREDGYRASQRTRSR